jgi:hypothetical protein
VKFVLFVEGYTEKYGLPAFLKRYPDPRLREPVGIKPVRFDGWAELVKDAPRKSRMYLNDPMLKRDILAVFPSQIRTITHTPHGSPIAAKRHRQSRWFELVLAITHAPHVSPIGVRRCRE